MSGAGAPADSRFADSVVSLPSLLQLGLSHVPVRASPPAVRRWGISVHTAPRTQHTPQRFTKPATNPGKLALGLNAHTSCVGVVGPVHAAVMLAMHVDRERHAHGARAGSSALTRMDNIVACASAHVSNLQRRTEAETIVADAALNFTEIEKRLYLSTVLEERAARLERSHRASRSSHAQLLVRAGAPSGSAVSLSRARRDAEKVEKAWRPVDLNGRVPPARPDVSSPRNAATLSPREGGVGTVHALSPTAHAALFLSQ